MRQVLARLQRGRLADNPERRVGNRLVLGIDVTDAQGHGPFDIRQRLVLGAADRCLVRGPKWRHHHREVLGIDPDEPQRLIGAYRHSAGVGQLGAVDLPEVAVGKLVNHIAKARRTPVASDLAGIPGPFSRQTIGTIQAIGHRVGLIVDIADLDLELQVVGLGIAVLQRFLRHLGQPIGLGDLQATTGHNVTKDGMGLVRRDNRPVGGTKVEPFQLPVQLDIRKVVILRNLLVVDLLEGAQQRKRIVVVGVDRIEVPPARGEQHRDRRLRPHNLHRATNQRGVQDDRLALAQNGQFDGLVGLRLGQYVFEPRVAVDGAAIDGHDAVAGLQPRLRRRGAGADHLDRTPESDAVIVHHHVSQVAGTVFEIAIPRAAQLDPSQCRSLVAQCDQHAIRILRVGIGRSYGNPLTGDFLLHHRGSRFFLLGRLGCGIFLRGRLDFRFGLDRLLLDFRRLVLLGFRLELPLFPILLVPVRDIGHSRGRWEQSRHHKRVSHQDQEGEYDEQYEIRQRKSRLGTFWHS